MVISTVGQVQATDGQTNAFYGTSPGTGNVRPKEEVKTSGGQDETVVRDSKEFEESVRQLQKISDMMDRKIQFNVNRELDKVVIKIVDPSTDKVIKEIPSADIQKLQVRIKEVLGLLFDEML
jgi:flagellar protein FlaG